MIYKETFGLYIPLRRLMFSFLSYINTMGHIEGDEFIDLYETLRSSKRQQELYEKGHSKVTTSMHQLGLAFDVWLCGKNGKYKTGSYLDKWDQWNKVGNISEAFSLQWGGHWKMKDKVHFETTFNKSKEELIFIFYKKERLAVWKELDKHIEQSMIGFKGFIYR